MSQENVTRFREALNAFNRRDKAAFLELCHPDYENVPPRDWPESATIRGREAIWDFFVAGQEPWQQASFEIRELIDAGNDKVVAEQVAQVQGKTSGAELLWSYWHVLTSRDGRAVRSEWFTERAEAFEAAGLSQ